MAIPIAPVSATTRSVATIPRSAPAALKPVLISHLGCRRPHAEGQTGGAPCNRGTFGRLLRELGILINGATGQVHASGLTPKADSEGPTNASKHDTGQLNKGIAGNG